MSNIDYAFVPSDFFVLPEDATEEQKVIFYSNAWLYREVCFAVDSLRDPFKTMMLLGFGLDTSDMQKHYKCDEFCSKYPWYRPWFDNTRSDSYPVDLKILYCLQKKNIIILF